MKKIIFLSFILISIIFLPDCFSQNEEQRLWLLNKATEKDSINPAKKSLKSTVIDVEDGEIEIDHGDPPAENDASGGSYKKPHNYYAKQYCNANNLTINQPFFNYLNGDGVTVLLFDHGRPMNGHVAFGERVFVPDQDFYFYDPISSDFVLFENSVPPVSLHPTLTTGTVAASSYNSHAEGMALNAEVIAYEWDFTQNYLAGYAAQGINLVCLPYGYLTGWSFFNNTWYWMGIDNQTESFLFGFYSQKSKQLDDILWHAPFLLAVKSAGNDRNEGSGIATGTIYAVWNQTTERWETKTFNGTIQPDCSSGTDCVSDFAVSKNVLTVGALKDQYLPLDVSSPGPTDDLRVKPDVVTRVVTNGNGVFSTTNATTETFGYATPGTSSAAAVLTGGAALLLQQQKLLYGKTKFLSSTLKALLIHTAQDLGPTGPDCKYGWGLVDIGKASELIEGNYLTNRNIHEFTFSSDEQEFIFPVKKAGLNTPLKVTICWTDPAGTPPAISVDPSDKMLVNDIDLRIIKKSTGEIKYPWRINPANPGGEALRTGDNSVDNVEQVYIDETSQDEYLVSIKPKAGKLLKKQVVSVIVTGADYSSLQANPQIDNTTIQNRSAFEGTNSVTLNNVTVNSDASCMAIAGNSVILKPGFKVSYGGYFRGLKRSDYFSAFEREYPSKVFVNTLEWINRDNDSKNTEIQEGMDREIEFTGSTETEIFPNPNKGMFYVNLSGFENIQSVEIYNTNGKLIMNKTENFKQYQDFDISRFSSGLYIIKIQTTSEIKTFKTIKN